MHIITLEDQDFPDLLNVFNDSHEVGRYWKDGKISVIRANHRLVMVCGQSNKAQIAIRPVRSISEAKELALEILAERELQGMAVERD